MNRLAKILVTVFLLSPVPEFPARAAEVNLVPSDPVVAVGSTFSVNITVGLNEEAGEQLAGGVIELAYDGSVVEILEVAIDPHWDFLPDPGKRAAPGWWAGIGFDVFENPPAGGNVVIASITLELLANGISQLAILPCSQFFSDTIELFPTCPGDYDEDFDVDGSDMLHFLLDPAGVSLSDLAAAFGKINCP